MRPDWLKRNMVHTLYRFHFLNQLDIKPEFISEEDRDRLPVCRACLCDHFTTPAL